MFLDNYPCTTSRFGHSLVFRGLSTAPAVLLLHGFMSSPYSLTWLGKQLNDAGYTVYIPRFPGHGTNAKDFLASTWKDWLRCVCDAYIDISSRHEQVFVAGHAMGGLLAGLIAARFNPEKLILFAPTFMTTDKRIMLAPLARFFVKTVPVNQIYICDEPDFKKAQSDYLNGVYVAKLVDLLKLMKLAKKNLEYVKAETLIVLSKQDAIVPFKVHDLLHEKIKAPHDYFIVNESSHTLFDDAEREKIAKRVIEFLKA